MNIISYLSSYFYESDKNESKEIGDGCVSENKYSKVDSHLLLWDLEHMNYTDLENKYKCKYIVICNLLREAGFSIYSKVNTPRSKLISIPILF